MKGSCQCDWATCVCKLVLIEVRLPSCHRDWEMDNSFLITFLREGSQIFEKDLVYKIGKRLEDLHLKWAEEEFTVV